jgi:hypothetical protein
MCAFVMCQDGFLRGNHPYELNMKIKLLQSIITIQHHRWPRSLFYRIFDFGILIISEYLSVITTGSAIAKTE